MPPGATHLATRAVGVVGGPLLLTLNPGVVGGHQKKLASEAAALASAAGLWLWWFHTEGR